MLLIVLDLLLVVARATVTYVNVIEIYYGDRQPLSYHQPDISAINHCIANGQVGSVACPTLKAKSRQWSWSSAVDVISSRSLLTVTYLSSLFVLLYLAAGVATSSDAVDVIVDVIYDIYSLRVRMHWSISENVVREQARLTTSTLMQSAQYFDLLALHAFDKYFQLGNSCLQH